MKLLFNISKVPRSLSKVEWKKLWRWKRETVKRLAKHEEAKIEMLQSDLPPHLKSDLMDHIINPPILLGPYQ